MAYSFKRASEAMAVTSMTTGVAFLANGLSEIVPIKAFGIYSAIIVPVNFILTVTVLPPMLVIYERNIKHCGLCCCNKKEKK